MKNLAIIGTAFALSSAAQAMTVATCTTNPQHDPRLVTTTFSVQALPMNRTMVVVGTNGGMRQFEIAPRMVSVTANHRGPEAVEYVNSQEDFELLVNFQPINGHIYGTYTGELNGQRVRASLVCNTTTLW